jgi:regulatory protein
MLDMNKQLFEAACYFLSKREYGAKELRDKLSRKFREINREQINELLERLQDLNYQSDKRYADMFIRARYNRNYGENHIRQEALYKGLDRDLVENAFQELALDFSSTCAYLANKHSKLDPPKLIRKLVAKGFAFQMVLNIIKKT